ncbi:MAG TPA: class E sortase [Actinocrinis sp.]|nr:class E sortase [Actinocrinis sp.]
MSQSAVRTVVSGLGQTMITVAVLIALYVVYLLTWTSVVAHASARADVCDLQREWAKSVSVQPQAAQPFATLQIPQIRNPEAWPVLDGVDQTELKQGVGWYPGSGLPGQAGNFAVAAHRRTWGDMFRYLNEVKAGDTVVVREANTVYTYKITQDPIYVEPNAVDVLTAIPGRSGFATAGDYITLTTCDPVYNATRRLVVFGELESQRTLQSVQVC